MIMLSGGLLLNQQREEGSKAVIVIGKRIQQAIPSEKYSRLPPQPMSLQAIFAGKRLVARLQEETRLIAFILTSPH